MSDASSAPKRSRRASGRVTLADVARAAEVSPITVSRALRGERSVDKELVERVRKAVDELHYVPDPAARALASQRSTQVLVLVPLLSNNLFVDVLESIHRTLFPQGFQPLIGVTHYDTAEEELLLRSSLRELTAALDANSFRQIHRATIVNMKAVAAVSRDDSGRGVLRLKQRSETLVVSQPFMSLFRGM